MNLKPANEDLQVFRTKLEGGLQVLFQSLSEEWGTTLKDRKKEDLDAFMVKWVEGVRNLFAQNEIRLWPGEFQNRLSSQAMSLPASVASLSSPQTLQPILSQAETAAMLRMIEELRREEARESEAAPPLPSKTRQLSWDLLDKTLEIRKSVPDDEDHKLTNIYLLLLACGTILTSFSNPVLYQTMHYTLSALGLGKIIKFIRER